MPTVNVNNGGILTPNTGYSSGTLPTINDLTQQQIDEIQSGLVVGTNNVDIFDPTDIPLSPNETVYRKRLVKVVSGKIVAERIVYMKRYAIAASGGTGDGYVFLNPTVAGGVITFFPMSVTLN